MAGITYIFTKNVRDKFQKEKQFDLEYLVEGFELDSLLSLCMYLCMYF